MSQRWLNLVKQWGKIWGVWWKGVQCWVMVELTQIKISSLKFWIVASLALGYKEVL
jgi:hypothetical protein